MGKSLLGQLHAEEKKRPVYVAYRKVQRHYEAHPTTPHEVASKIKAMQDRADKMSAELEIKHAEELLPLLKRKKELDDEAKAMGRRHRDEEEAIIIKLATAELALLEGRITEIPDDIPKLSLLDRAKRVINRKAG